MKLDDFLPEYDVRSQHSVEIDAATAEVCAAISATSFFQIPLVRRLLALRGLGGERANKSMRESLLQGCFIELCNLRDEEIAFGLAGKFWQPSGGRGRLESTEQFAAFAEPGHLKVAWNFLLIPLSGHATRLQTETRVHAYGRSARWKFRLYWTVVAPFSGLMRKSILRDVKHRAEHDKPSETPVPKPH